MSEIVVPETPNWLKGLEEKREQRLKAKLGHEAGAGAPCLKCGEKCPGLDLHFWRKACKICRCPKEEHDVHDDDIYGWAQFQLLGSKPNKIKTKIVLPGKKDEVELEWAPKGSKDTIDKYLKTLPPEKLPVKGSKAAQDRKQLLQKQLPIHDIDPTLCHELNEDELNKMNDYIAHVKKTSVGVGQIVNLSSIVKGNLHNLNPQEAAIIASRYAKGISLAEIVKLQAQNNAIPLQKLQISDKNNAKNLPNYTPNSLFNAENFQNPFAASKIKDINLPSYAKESKNPLVSSQFSKPFSNKNNYEIDENLLKTTSFNPKNTPSQFIPNVASSENYGDVRPNCSENLPKNTDKNCQYGFENPYFNIGDTNVPYSSLENAETLKNKNKHLPNYAATNIGVHSENVQPKPPKNLKDLVFSTYENVPSENLPLADNFGQNVDNRAQIGQNIDNRGQNVPSFDNYGQNFDDGKQIGQNICNKGQNIPSLGSYGQNVVNEGQIGQHIDNRGQIGQNLDNTRRNIPSPDNYTQNVGEQRQTGRKGQYGQNIDNRGQIGHNPDHGGQNVQPLGNYGQNVINEGQFGRDIDQGGQNMPSLGNYGQIGQNIDTRGQIGQNLDNRGHNIPFADNYTQNVGEQKQIGHKGQYGQNIDNRGQIGHNPDRRGQNVQPLGSYGQNVINEGQIGQDIEHRGQNRPSLGNYGQIGQNIGSQGKYGQNIDNKGQNIASNDSENSRNVFTPKKPLSKLNPGEINTFVDVLEPHQVHVGAIRDIYYPDKEILSAVHGTNDFYEDYSPENIKEILDNIKLPDCHYCKKSFEENEFAVTIDRANVLFHAECFKCAGCNQSLADNVYFYHKESDNVYCGRDYAKIRGIPRCKACDELIFTKEYCLAENSTFHLKHFCCIECDIPLAGRDYTLEDEYPYCLPCFERSKAAKCGTCFEVIKPDEQGCQLNNIHFHAGDECFSCFVCHKPLMGKKLLLRHERLFCSHDCLNSFKV